MGYIDFPLDEVYPIAVDGGHLDIPFFGTAKIQYSGADEWWLDELTLTAWGRESNNLNLWRQPINRDDPLFQIISKFLSRECSEEIAAQIRQDAHDQNESRLFDEGKERAKLRGTGALI